MSALSEGLRSTLISKWTLMSSASEPPSREPQAVSHLRGMIDIIASNGAATGCYAKWDVISLLVHYTVPSIFSMDVCAQCTSETPGGSSWSASPSRHCSLSCMTGVHVLANKALDSNAKHCEVPTRLGPKAYDVTVLCNISE